MFIKNPFQHVSFHYDIRLITETIDFPTPSNIYYSVVQNVSHKIKVNEKWNERRHYLRRARRHDSGNMKSFLTDWVMNLKEKLRYFPEGIIVNHFKNSRIHFLYSIYEKNILMSIRFFWRIWKQNGRDSSFVFNFLADFDKRALAISKKDARYYFARDEEENYELMMGKWMDKMRGQKVMAWSWNTFCNLSKLRYGLNGLITVQLWSYRL